MAFLPNLLSAGIIEKDINNDILWTWSYPFISPDLKLLLSSKCGLENDSSHPDQLVSFFYCHHQQFWFYLHVIDVNEHFNLPRVKQFVLILQTSDYNPEKYKSLCKILSKAYSDTGNPAHILNLYLSVFIKGMCSRDNGTFTVKHFEKVTGLSCAPAKDVVKTFGLETILIYTALLLKKRIVVYHHKLDILIEFVRSLPAFVWHRQDWDIIYPYMQLSYSEICELLSLQTYVAGFRNAAVEGRTELYDLFVNLPAIEITISTHAKELFVMTKTHKEIAVFMTRQAENNDLTEKMFIKEISNKTNELLNNLRMLSVNSSGCSKIKLQTLKEKKLAPALENFLWNLAAAEGYADV